MKQFHLSTDVFLHLSLCLSFPHLSSLHLNTSSLQNSGYRCWNIYSLWESTFFFPLSPLSRGKWKEKKKQQRLIPWGLVPASLTKRSMAEEASFQLMTISRMTDGATAYAASTSLSFSVSQIDPFDIVLPLREIFYKRTHLGCLSEVEFWCPIKDFGLRC